jgi:hypothetical protein
MYLANFFHIYQPPTQKEKILKRVTEESYEKIFKILLTKKRARVTMNITGCLTELWKEQGYDKVINQVRKLLEQGRLELTESAIYHPFLPGLPKREMVRQIKLNREVNKKAYGNAYKPRGFFPPEMAYEERVGQVASEMGYEWIILDEASCPSPLFDEGAQTKVYEMKHEDVTDDVSSMKYIVSGMGKTKIHDTKYMIQNTEERKLPLRVFFRERPLSFLILSAQIVTGSILVGELEKRLSNDGYVITGMDGETFGHHRPGLEQLLVEMFENEKIETVTISDLMKMFEGRKKVRPVPATWALMNTQMARNAPFARWNDPENSIHQMQWHLTHLAIGEIEKAEGKIRTGKDKKQWQAARKLLDKALHSDQYWWASAKPWWSLEMIERGAKELVEAVGSCPLVAMEKVKEAKELYTQIIMTGFDWQREGMVEDLHKAHQDEELAFGLQLETPDVPEKEYRQVVARLKEQEKQAVKERNYDLATRFKERLEMLAFQRKKIKNSKLTM